MKLRVVPHALLLLLCVCFVATGQTPRKPQPSPTVAQNKEKDDSEYRKLVERVKHGDMDVDFIRLRAASAEWLCDGVNTDAPNREAMVAAFDQKEYAKAVELVEVVLDYEFTHVGLHRAAEDAYRKLDNTAKADYHKAVADKLVNALLTSGDGKTPKTAYRVLSIREEYFVMNKLGYTVSRQALLSSGDTPYDLLSGKDPKTGNEVSIYFDISSFFGDCKPTKK